MLENCRLKSEIEILKRDVARSNNRTLIPPARCLYRDIFALSQSSYPPPVRPNFKSTRVINTPWTEKSQPSLCEPLNRLLYGNDLSGYEHPDFKLRRHHKNWVSSTRDGAF